MIAPAARMLQSIFAAALLVVALILPNASASEAKAPLLSFPIVRTERELGQGIGRRDNYVSLTNMFTIAYLIQCKSLPRRGYGFRRRVDRNPSTNWNTTTAS